MKPTSSDPNHLSPGPGRESQMEYIRRIELRIQELSRLIELRRAADHECDAESVAAGLKEYALTDLAFPHGEVFMSSPSSNGAPTLVARAIRDAQTVLTSGPPGEEGEPIPGFPGAGPQAAVPIACGEGALGAIVVEARPDMKDGIDPWPLSLLEEAARDAGCTLMRIRAKRDRETVRARIEAMARLEDAILNSTRLDEVLARGVRAAVETLGAAWGAAWVVDRSKYDDLRVAATFGVAAATTGENEAEDRLDILASHARQAIRGRGVLRRPTGKQGSAATFAAVSVPIIAFGEVLGAIGLAGRPGKTMADFGAEDEPFLRLLAAHAALAIQNASVSERQREAERRLHEAEIQLVHTAKLAALGEMSAKLAHEIRNPLSSIGGFARRIEKALPEEDSNRAYATIITRETQRLEAILTEHLDFARIQPPRLEIVDLNATVRETIELVRPECEVGGVRLLEAYESRIPGMLLDSARVKQVLLNILKNARQSTHQGQRIRVRTRAADGWAQIEIANDGEKLPGEILEQLFVPFATSKSSGCGLGLAVADQIVKEHGGEIRVRSDSEWSVIFTVSFPIRTNQDRRRTTERRTRDRRRAA